MVYYLPAISLTVFLMAKRDRVLMGNLGKIYLDQNISVIDNLHDWHRSCERWKFAPIGLLLFDNLYAERHMDMSCFRDASERSVFCVGLLRDLGIEMAPEVVYAK